MPRPATKQDLILTANEQFDKMWKLIDTMPYDAPEIVFDFRGDPSLKEAHWKRDKNIRDVLTHLYEWHQLLLNWVQTNQAGEQKPFLPEPYTWKTYADMNMGFWKKHQGTSYEESRKMLIDSHSKVMGMIESFSNDELFIKKHFPWTGTTNLGSYCVSATSSHYDWAIKKIKKYKKLKEEFV